MNFDQRSHDFFSDLFRSKKLPIDFYKSIEYSFFSGGKRVRPECVRLVGEALGLGYKKLYPAALAVELVHTYSLVHDDLPSMDNDTYRRGKLTHHVKYGEASAVLAGDSFLTLAFQVLAEGYQGQKLKNLLLELSNCSGLHGMVGGQVLDCLTKKRSQEIFESIHYLKTAKLFEYSFVAPGLIAEVKSSDLKSLKALGKNLGLLFQLQDDLFDEDKKDERFEENILSIVTKNELVNLIKEKEENIKKSLFELSDLSANSKFTEFLDKVIKRTH